MHHKRHLNCYARRLVITFVFVTGVGLQASAQDENAKRPNKSNSTPTTTKINKTTSRGPTRTRPSAATAPKVVPSTLTVNVSPADSSIWVNNERITVDGTGKLTLNLMPGVHTIIARHDGFRDGQLSTQIKAGENPTISLSLEQLPGKLSIKPSIDGASIELKPRNGDQALRTFAGAVEQTELPPGDYEVTISRTGYHTLNRTVTLKAGSILELELHLEPLPPARPTVNRPPAPMTAYAQLDGKFLLVRLNGRSGDMTTMSGTIEVSVSKSALAPPAVLGSVNGGPCVLDFVRLDNIEEWSFVERPSSANQYSNIIVKVRPKDSKRPIRFNINWRASGGLNTPTNSVVTEALPIKKVLPALPAAGANTSGEVNVSVRIDEQGNVVAAKALDGPAVLRKPAEDAARQWKFQPATSNGMPVVTNQLIRFSFVK